MIMMKRIIKSLGIISLFVLSSCSNDSVPRQGIKHYIESVNDQYRLLEVRPVSLNYADYVWITGSGRLAAGKLKDSVYYYVSYHFQIEQNAIDCLTYVVYYKQSDSFTELDEEEGTTAFAYAYDLVKDGSFKGQTGTIK